MEEVVVEEVVEEEVVVEEAVVVEEEAAVGKMGMTETSSPAAMRCLPSSPLAGCSAPRHCTLH